MAVFATKKLTGLDARVGPVTATDTFIATDAAGVAGMGYGTTGAQISSFLGSIYQPLDSDLTALAANTNNGLWARTGAGTGAARTITGTASQILVTNGDGVAGNPTLALDMTALDARYIDTVDTALQTMAGPLRLPAGSLAAPTLDFAGAGGFYYDSTLLAIVAQFGGVSRFELAAATATFRAAVGGNSSIVMISDGVSNITQTVNRANAQGALNLSNHARGTAAAPADLITNDQVLQLRGDGYGGGGFRQSINITATVIEATPGATAMAPRLDFNLAALGGITPASVVRIERDTGLSMFTANVVIDQNRIFRPRSYTIATLPTVPATGIIFCSDLGGAGGNLSSNGTAWVRETDGAPLQLGTAAASTFTWQHYTSAVSYFQANPFGATSYTVTLGTTGIVDGAHAVFVREVASTGAGVWDIGGLKSLAPGTGCEVKRVAGAWKLERAWTL